MFEWDDAKNASNRNKHGIGFEEAQLIFDGPILSADDARAEYGEARTISIGAVAGRLVVVVVHTDRGGATRIISARLANRRERRLYDERIRQASGGHGGPR